MVFTTALKDRHSHNHRSHSGSRCLGTLHHSAGLLRRPRCERTRGAVPSTHRQLMVSNICLIYHTRFYNKWRHCVLLWLTEAFRLSYLRGRRAVVDDKGELGYTKLTTRSH